MTPATIELILGVLEGSLPLLCVLMAAAALFLFALHRYATKLAKVSLREREQRTLPQNALLQDPPIHLRPLRSSSGRTTSRSPE